MPTYTNGTGAPFAHENLNGDTVFAPTGATFQTYKFYSDSGLTKTADAPLWTPYNAAQTEVTASAAGEKAVYIADDTKTIRIESVSVEVEVWLHNKSENKNKMRSELQPGDCPIDIVTNGSVKVLILVFTAAGSAIISEMK